MRLRLLPVLVACASALNAGVAGAEYFQPHGYVRSDDLSAVVYRGTNDHVYELWMAPGGQWSRGDLTVLANAPVPATDPMPYVRTAFDCCLDTNSVVYVATSGKIIDLSLQPDQGVWHRSNLTGLSGAPLAATNGALAATTRFGLGSNPIWSVTFKSQASGHLYEIKRGANGDSWSAVDITAASGAPAPLGSPNSESLWAGYQDIFYRVLSGHVIHVGRYGVQPWLVEDLTSITSGPTTLTDAMAVVHRPDNYTSVAVRGVDGKIYEFYQNIVSDPTWRYGGPGNLAGAPIASSAPVGYVRADDTYSIVYNTSNGHIIELHLSGSWHYHDLTVLAGAPVAGAGIPSAYVRGDGLNSVAYRGANNHTYELYSYGGNSWLWEDLTALSQ